MSDGLVYILIGVALVAFFALKNLGKTSAEEARKLIEDGALLLDVRSPGEFAGGHIDGAVNVPVQDLSRRIDELGERSKPIVLYCQSGMRSGSAKRMLRGAGFTDVYDVGAISRLR